MQNQSYQTFSQFPPSNNPPNPQSTTQQSSCNKLTDKFFLFWLSTLLIGFGVMISVIIIVAKSVPYFQSLFVMANDQLLARSYLKQYYSLDMAMLYLSIIGFMIVLMGSIVYIGKFLLEKNNLTYFHILFLLAYVATGVAMIIKRGPYGDMIKDLAGKSINDPDCVLRGFECLLAKSFIDYESSFLSFFIAFCILFFVYGILFHLNSKWQFEESLKQVPKAKASNHSQKLQSRESNMLITEQGVYQK